MSRVIQLDAILSQTQNDAIQVYSANSIVQVIDTFDYAIDSVNLYGTPELFVQIHPSSTDSSLAFGTAQLNQIIFVESTESTVVFGDAEPQLNIVVTDEIESELVFGTSSVNFKLFAESTTTQNAFETDHQLNFIAFPNALESTLAFGNFTQLNMEITNVPFPSIESTLIIPQPNVLKVIGPLGIGSTESVGVSSFVDNIHRLLVFKDDNISKIGENDAAVISGGIRLNPASTASNTATSGSSSLPEAPVGFLSVNIGGVDYKIPYYNS
jgi:hypothetical protein